MQNQAPGYFHLNDLRSLYWKIVPFLRGLIQLVISTRRIRCVRIIRVVTVYRERTEKYSSLALTTSVAELLRRLLLNFVELSDGSV
eukprot:COSAG02_NODE_1910_length_10418_cov_44.653552_12_plen_86_part_00